MLYNKHPFKSEDLDAAVALINKYPFATLISVVGGEALVSHLPLVLQRSAQGMKLIGHVARANPHSSSLAGAKCTVIFHGPHTYITPKWYAENDVPTWNYSVVHIDGQVELVDDSEGILGCLRSLSSHAESLWPSGWEFFVPEDLAAPGVLEKRIVGFKISVDKLNFKGKLSQNRSAEDQSGVIMGLRSRDDDQSRAVRQSMQDLRR